MPQNQWILTFCLREREEHGGRIHQPGMPVFVPQAQYRLASEGCPRINGYSRFAFVNERDMDERTQENISLQGTLAFVPQVQYRLTSEGCPRSNGYSRFAFVNERSTDERTEEDTIHQRRQTPAIRERGDNELLSCYSCEICFTHQA